MRYLMLAAALCVSAAATPALGQSAEAARFQSYIDQCHAAHVCNGVYLVARDGQPVFAGAVGDRGDEARTPLDVDTPFDIGSVSKQFTSMAVLRLASEGRLGLDDRVATHLPGFPYADVTVAQLLSHTSGVPDVVGTYSSRLRGGDPALVLTGEDIVQVLVELDRPAVAAPGASYAYNNTGYIVLSNLVEAVSGRPFGNYLDQTFFRPLGMQDTWLRTPNDGRDNAARALGFTPRADGERRPFDQIPRFYIRGAGGLYSTASDLLIWENALNAGRVVPLPWLQAATLPTPLNDGTTTPYGFGLSLKPAADGQRRVSHAGHWRAFKSDLSFFPDSDLTIIQLTNNAEDDSVDANVDALAAVADGRTPPPVRAPIGRDLYARLDGDPATTRAWFRGALDGGAYDLREDELNALGYALLEAARKDEAVLVFQLGIEAFPRSANMLDSLADAQEAQGDLTAALQAVRQALVLAPEAQALQRRAQALEERLAATP